MTKEELREEYQKETGESATLEGANLREGKYYDSAASKRL